MTISIFRNPKSQLLSYVVVAAGVFIYILIRALNVGITYDEAWTINGFVHRPVMDLINYTPSDANHHLLNTLLIKLSFGIGGGESVFLARIPNLLGGILFLVFATRICREFLSFFVGFGLFLAFVLNPFMLDFFGLARGYGLSVAFETVSIYYLLRYIRDHKGTFATLSLVFGGIAVLANFTLLTYFIALFGILFLLPLVYRSLYNNRKQLIWNGLVLLGLTALIYEPVRKLNKNDNLWYGGGSGFYDDTVYSLAKYTCYSPDETPAILLGLKVMLLLAATAFIAAIIYRRTLHSQARILLIILLLCCTGIILQHQLLGTLFVIDRAALYLLPLFVLAMAFSLEELKEKLITKICVPVIALFFVVNFSVHANTYKTALWFFDAHTEKVLAELHRRAKRSDHPIRVEYSWPYHAILSYYKEAYASPNLQIIEPGVVDSTITPDYYVYLSRPIYGGYNTDSDRSRKMKKQVVLSYPREHVVLYKIKKD